MAQSLLVYVLRPNHLSPRERSRVFARRGDTRVRVLPSDCTCPRPRANFPPRSFVLSQRAPSRPNPQRFRADGALCLEGRILRRAQSEDLPIDAIVVLAQHRCRRAGPERARGQTPGRSHETVQLADFRWAQVLPPVPGLELRV